MKNGTDMFELTEQQLLKEARNSKSSLLERSPIAGTPFEVVKENEKWFGVFGYNKLTEDFDEMQDVLTWMEENHWELLVRVITMVVQTIDLHKMKMAKEAHEHRLKAAKEKGEKAGANQNVLPAVDVQTELTKLDEMRMRDFEQNQKAQQ